MNRLTYILLLFLAVPAHAEIIKVATSTYCPLACSPEEYPHDGIMHEVLRKAFADTEYTLDFTYIPYGRAVQETIDGFHDVVTYAGTPNTPDFVFRAQYGYDQRGSVRNTCRCQVELYRP